VLLADRGTGFECVRHIGGCCLIKSKGFVVLPQQQQYNSLVAVEQGLESFPDRDKGDVLLQLVQNYRAVSVYQPACQEPLPLPMYRDTRAASASCCPSRPWLLTAAGWYNVLLLSGPVQLTALQCR
jgi:hypothetical protein